MLIFQYRRAPGVQALRSDYPQGSCHQAFGSLIKMVCGVHLCVCARALVRVHVCRRSSSAALVINDSGDERTSRVSPFCLFRSDLRWSGCSGHEPPGDLKNPCPFSHLHHGAGAAGMFTLARSGRFLDKDALSHRERMFLFQPHHSAVL